VPAGQRDQSAAALPIWGGLETARARFALSVVLVVRFGVRVTVRLSSIENGWRGGEYEAVSSNGIARETSYASVARTTASARWIGGPAACNSPPSAL